MLDGTLKTIMVPDTMDSPQMIIFSGVKRLYFLLSHRTTDRNIIFIRAGFPVMLETSRITMEPSSITVQHSMMYRSVNK